jgi:hypothetical protein
MAGLSAAVVDVPGPDSGPNDRLEGEVKLWDKPREIPPVNFSENLV